MKMQIEEVYRGEKKTTKKQKKDNPFTWKMQIEEVYWEEKKKQKKKQKKKEVCQYLRRCKENMKFLVIKNDDENWGLSRWLIFLRAEIR